MVIMLGTWPWLAKDARKEASVQYHCWLATSTDDVYG